MNWFDKTMAATGVAFFVLIMLGAVYGVTTGKNLAEPLFIELTNPR